MIKIGITERGDAALDQSWRKANMLGMILITKAPHKIGVLPDNAILHCTITGYGGTIIEPGVAPALVTLEAYKNLVNTYGSERIVLRVDPIIPTLKGIQTAKEIISHQQGRVRISFLDAYSHVRERFEKLGLQLPWTGIHAPLEIRQQAVERIKQEVLFRDDLEICGEPGLDCTGCISQRDMQALGLICKLSGKCTQRTSCACVAEKTELLSNPHRCAHNCLYCYWKD